MLCKTYDQVTKNVALGCDTHIIFNDYLQFTITPQQIDDKTYIFHAKNFKGDFEIERVMCGWYCRKMDYNPESQSFKYSTEMPVNFTFYISANIEYKKVDYVEVNYLLEIPKNRLQLLNMYEYFEYTIQLPGYPMIELKCHVKKSKIDTVSVVVENPFNIKINGKLGKFVLNPKITSDFSQIYTFVFDPFTWNPNEPQKPSLNESRPESALSSENASTPTSKSMYAQHPNGIMIDSKYEDVKFLIADGVSVGSHRCLLAKHSQVFEKLFQESKSLPVLINAKAYTYGAVGNALRFLQGRSCILGNRVLQMLEFANGFEIDALKNACRFHMEENVDSSNVCEYIHVAYQNNFEELKKKCVKIIADKKDQIEKEQLKSLSKEMFFDIFCTL